MTLDVVEALVTLDAVEALVTLDAVEALVTLLLTDDCIAHFMKIGTRKQGELHAYSANTDHRPFTQYS